MIISFIGNVGFCKTGEKEKVLLAFLEKAVADTHVCFYLRESSSFDDFAYGVCKKYKETHPNARLCFVTPYITESYQKKVLSKVRKKYDMVVYPEIEEKPLRLALLYRNRWMMKTSDFTVAHCRSKSTKYQANKKRGKRVFIL